MAGLVRCGLILGAVAWGSSGSVAQAGPVFHSYILRDTAFASNPEITPPDPNTIFTFDSATGVAVVGSTRLATLLAGTGARVDAFSYGRDFGHWSWPHSFFLWSISLTSSETKEAAPKTPLYFEPIGEAEADIFWVRDFVDTTTKLGVHGKLLDENSASPVANTPGVFTPAAHLGLHGTLGKPLGVGADVSNVAGFDFWPPAFADRDIYFSVDQAVTIGTVAVTPADILLLPFGATTVTIYRTAASLGLDPASDDIDALAMNPYGLGLFPIVGLGIGIFPAVGWYSLTRGSASLPANGFSAADIFEFSVFVDYSLPGSGGFAAQLHRTAQSMGLLASTTIQADVDGLSHIDPDSFVCPGYPGSLVGPGPEVGTQVGAGGGVGLGAGMGIFAGSYALRVAGQPVGAFQGTELSPQLSVFPPGTYEVLELVGQKGSKRLVDGALVEIPSPGVPPIQALTVQALTSSTLEWNWSPPMPNPYSSIEVLVDGEPPALSLAASATDFTMSFTAPGVHFLEVRGVVASDRSEPRFASADVTPGGVVLQPPDSVVASVSGTTVSLSWEHPVTYDDVEVHQDGLLSMSLGPAVALTPGAVTIANVPAGLHEFTVRGSSGGTSSIGSAVKVYVSVPLPGEVLQSTGFVGGTPVALTLSGSTLFVADGALGAPAFAYDANDLTLPPIVIASPMTGQVTGLASDSSLLYWAIDDQLWVTNHDGSSPIFAGPFGFATGTGIAGEMTRGAGDDLWVVDRDHAEVARHSAFDASFTGATLSHPRHDGSLGGVAYRGGDVFEISHGPVGSQASSHVSAIGSGDGLRASIPIGSLGADVRAVEFRSSGANGVASLFMADGATGTIFEVAAISPVPDAAARNCHDGFVGVTREVLQGPLSIPPASVHTFALDVVGGTVADLDVRLELTHPNFSEVHVVLASPAGTEVILFDHSGVSGDRLVRWIDDVRDSGFSDGFGDHAAEDAASLLAAYDGEPATGTWLLEVHNSGVAMSPGTLDLVELSICSAPVVAGPEFLRGDSNADGGLNIADAVYLLGFLFPGVAGPNPLQCRDAADANDDGGLNIADAVAILGTLFGFPPVPLPPPFGNCGPDPTSDALDCVLHPC